MKNESIHPHYSTKYLYYYIQPQGLSRNGKKKERKKTRLGPFLPLWEKREATFLAYPSHTQCSHLSPEHALAAQIRIYTSKDTTNRYKRHCKVLQIPPNISPTDEQKTILSY
jgi:hypothetical protein